MSIASNIEQLNTMIQALELRYQRPPSSILLLAVSKGQSVAKIQEAIDAGLWHFGENYYQEARVKIQALTHAHLCWHFLGAIQRNKVKGISTHFDWVHSLSRLDIAEQLHATRPNERSPLNVCIQLNIDDEPTKSGIQLADVIPFARAILALPKLHLRGFMVIPKPNTTCSERYETFLHVANQLMELNQTLGCSLDTLSMGMSDDWPDAVRAGSTIIRVGRSIFGERNTSTPTTSSPQLGNKTVS